MTQNQDQVPLLLLQLVPPATLPVLQLLQLLEPHCHLVLSLRQLGPLIQTHWCLQLQQFLARACCQPLLSSRLVMKVWLPEPREPGEDVVPGHWLQVLAAQDNGEQKQITVKVHMLLAGK